MNKKVYFAGSIRAGRVDAELYHRMVIYIQKTDIVLTEHVGFLNLKESREDRRIYEQDTALTGDPYFRIYPYEKEKEIYPVIDEILHRQVYRGS